MARSASSLSLREGNMVTESLALGMGEKGFSQSELQQALDDVHKGKLMGSLADLVLTGNMEIRIEDGVVTYMTRPDAPIFKEEESSGG